MRNERLTIMLTPEEKASLAAKAAHLGVTSGDVVRLALDAFGDEEMRVLETVAASFADTMADCRRTLQATNDRVEASLAELRAEREQRAAA